MNSSVNIPFMNEGMGDADYLYAFQQIVMPIAYEFAPDLVIGAWPAPMRRAVQSSIGCYRRLC